MSTKLNKYEGMFLMSTNHTSDVDGSIKLVKAAIEKHQGQLLVIKKWDERKLAYEIGKAKRGLFVIAFFNAPGANITALEREVRLSEDFIRVMITRADHLSVAEMEAVEPQPIAPPQPERAPWDAPPGVDFGAPPVPRNARPPRRRDDAGVAAEAAVGKD